jgi:hypothetical protein
VPGDELVLTYDHRLLAEARDAGLVVAAPGLDL